MMLDQYLYALRSDVSPPQHRASVVRWLHLCPY